MVPTRPRLLVEPPGIVDSLGEDAVALAAHAGLHLDPWQSADLALMLSRRADGKWAAFEFAHIVARQNGKGAVLEARELAGLFLIDTDQTILHSAHEAKTSREAFLRISTLIKNTPDLHKRVASYYQSNDNIAIHLKNDKRLRFVTRTRGGGRGFSGDLIIIDEAYELDSGPIAALLPVLSARTNGQLAYASSGGMEGSEHLHSVRRRALAGGGESLAWCEYSPDSEAADFDIDDQQAWADANPSLDIRITLETIRREREIMTADVFARERLTIFDADRSDAARTVDPAAWAARHHPNANMAGPVTLGVAVSLDRAWSAVAAVGRCDHGHWLAEVIEVRNGTGWVAPAVAGYLERNPDISEVSMVDAGPSGELAVSFDGAGLAYSAMKSNEYGRACGALLSAVVELDRPADQCVCHLSDPLLNLAVGNVHKKPFGDAWAWMRGDSDVSALEAVTVAFGRAVASSGVVVGPSVYEERGFLSL